MHHQNSESKSVAEHHNLLNWSPRGMNRCLSAFVPYARCPCNYSSMPLWPIAIALLSTPSLPGWRPPLRYLPWSYDVAARRCSTVDTAGKLVRHVSGMPTKRDHRCISLQRTDSSGCKCLRREHNLIESSENNQSPADANSMPDHQIDYCCCQAPHRWICSKTLVHADLLKIISSFKYCTCFWHLLIPWLLPYIDVLMAWIKKWKNS
jgi:hypothetical protein